MSTDIILVVPGSLFLMVIGIAVGLTVAERGSAARDHRQARFQEQLNAERIRLDAERTRFAERTRSQGPLTSRNN